jgi:hypothetical protein
MERPAITAEPTMGQKMGERTTQMKSDVSTKAGGMTSDISSKATAYGEKGVAKAKDIGGQISDRTKQVTKGRSAEDMASEAGETIGRGIRKAAAVIGGAISGMRRGVEGNRQNVEERSMEGGRRMEGEYRETTTREMPSEPSQPYRETEYSEVKKKEKM